MLEIEQAKGLLMTPDGQIHPFGVHTYESTDKWTHDNMHDSAFQKEVRYAPWFIETQEKLGFQYPEDTIFRQAMKMAGKGIVTVLNACESTVQGEEYNVFAYYLPETLSEPQREQFEQHYQELKEMIERKHAYIEFSAFNENGNYAWDRAIYSLDEFYEKNGYKKETKKTR